MNQWIKALFTHIALTAVSLYKGADTGDKRALNTGITSERQKLPSGVGKYFGVYRRSRLATLNN